jgi:hypothetical protein
MRGKLSNWWDEHEPSVIHLSESRRAAATFNRSMGWANEFIRHTPFTLLVPWSCSVLMLWLPKCCPPAWVALKPSRQ